MKGGSRLTRAVSCGLVAVALGACGLFRGAINASPGVRWWLFSTYGAEKMCPEMLKRGAPLRLSPGGNTIGRFYPTTCRHEVNDAQQTIAIHFGGTGYAWTPVAGLMGFSVEAAVEYRPDFQMEEDAVYVFARMNRVLHGPTFAIGSVENALVQWAARTPVGYLANTFAGQIVESQLASGFTVVRTDQGDDFSVGILRPPALPKHPFGMDEDRLTLANETTEVRAQQLDFVGPLEVGDDDQALYLRYRVTGTPVDAMVFARSVGDGMRDAMQRGLPVIAHAPPIAGFVVQPGLEQKQRVRLPRGQYYLVIDNSSRLGQVAPPWSPIQMFGGGTSIVSYSVELGDEDD